MSSPEYRFIGPTDTLQITQYEWAMAQITKRGGKVAYPIELPSMESLQYEGKSVTRSVACQSSPPLTESPISDPSTQSTRSPRSWKSSARSWSIRPSAPSPSSSRGTKRTPAAPCQSVSDRPPPLSCSCSHTTTQLTPTKRIFSRRSNPA